ncbi:MAG TPA: ParB/RepB/Spo0J family partition protein, partial [Terriglobales bacterium]|nr:ParB/RepB/Spo0J family partition protein [Terriglobales bacterium]
AGGGGISISAAAAPAREADSGVNQIDVGLIDRNPYQTRRSIDEQALAELAASIAANGVIQPVVVRQAGERFQLIAGERRWLASRRAGKLTIPAVVKQVSNEQALEMTIVENLQREDLNPMEHARAFERLAREFALTQEQMAQRTGKERATIANYLRLMKLPAPVQQAIEAGELSFGHAKVLVGMDSIDLILKAAQHAMEQRLSVRGLENLIMLWTAVPPEEPEARPKAAPDPNVRAAQDELERALGCRVEVRDRKGRGKIVIHYSSLEDFDRVVEALAK